MKVKGKFSSVWRVGIAVVLAASLALIAAPVGASPGYTEIGGCLGTCDTEDIALWSTTQVHPDPETLTVMGVYSAFLDKVTGDAGPTYVQFLPPAGTTFADLQAAITAATPKWSFWHWLENTGVTNGPQFELRFEDPASTGWLEVTAVGLQGTTGTAGWLEEILGGTTPAGFGGNTPDGSSVFDWVPLTPLSDILADVNTAWGAAETGTVATNYVLERVRVELWEAIDQSCYIDDITIDGERYDLEPDYSLDPNLALNVKTADATFTVRDPCDVAIAAALVDNWIVTKGEGSGEVTIIAGGDTAIPDAAPHNYITVRMVTTGDCIITCDVDQSGGGEEEEDIVTLHAEKKWGELHHTILDVDDSTTAVEHTKTVRREEGVVHVETIKDTVYAEFLELTNPQTAGGALVHWWLFKDTTANQNAIDALMDDLAADNGFLYDGYWSATGQYDPTDPPIDVINALVATQHATDTTWTALPLGGTIVSGWYATTTTPGDLPGEVRGITTATLTNDGDDEAVMIVVLVDYPIDKNGENRICIEKGKKTFTTVIVPPPYLEKIPQVAWAGEKVTLEQSWGTDFNGHLVSFQLEHPGLGTLEAVNDGDCQVSGDLVYTQVIAGVARCILDSEDPGQADVKVVLREDEITGSETVCTEVEDGLLGIVVQTGLVVYYLKLESITPLDPDPAALVVDVDAEFGIEVKGWFTSSNTSTRVARPVDHDGDGVMDAVLPAGRWVMPDDWSVLAGADWETLRPHWDIMDAPDDDIISEVPYDEWGAYDSDVNTPAPPIGPGEAEYPVIGPFSLLQPFAATQWLATAMVPADATVSLTGLDLRTTVVPDGLLDAWDCPMPPAEIICNADSDLSEADKGDIYVTVLGAYTTPFYASEIPATQFIPPMIAGNGYEWDSWDIDGASALDEGPYDFWTDLNVSPDDDEALEVYSDNHGIAYVTIDALSSAGSVIISATADYPYLTGKHGAMKSDEVTQDWGDIAPETCTWSFTAAGFFPRHLPDSYTGEVVLADLVLLDIPAQVQGVWYYDDVAAEWIYWIPGFVGDLLVLEGGLVADYNVLVSGACDWIIPLP